MMISAKEAAQLFNDKWEYQNILDDIEKAIKIAINNEKRTIYYYIGDCTDCSYIPELKEKYANAVYELRKLGYIVEYCSYGSPYVAIGDSVTYKNYGLVVTF